MRCPRFPKKRVHGIHVFVVVLDQNRIMAWQVAERASSKDVLQLLQLEGGEQ